LTDCGKAAAETRPLIWLARCGPGCGEDATDVAVDLPQVGVFHGDGARFASAVFEGRDDALTWVARHQLTGIVTAYTLGRGCYDLALEQGRFHPTKPHQHTSQDSRRLARIHVRDGHPA